MVVPDRNLRRRFGPQPGEDQAAVLTVERSLKAIGLNPEELIEQILRVNEEMYTNAHFVEIARVYPDNKKLLNRLSKARFSSLLPTEKMILLTSRIGCVNEKIRQIKLKRKYTKALNRIKLTMGWATKVSEFLKRKDFDSIERLIGQMAKENELQYTPFGFSKIIPLQMPDGSLFIDNVAAAVLSNQPREDNIQLINKLGWADNAFQVSPVYKMRASLREIQSEIKDMESMLDRIVRIPTHPKDNFYNVMKPFIAESKTNIKMLLGTADMLENEIKRLYDKFAISTKTMGTEEFFSEAVALARAFKASAQRVRV
ncbi:hypothetical protein CHUAL_003754 [Chamberlinius hualienensis]